MAALGVSGTLRVSFAPYNNLQDVDALASGFTPQPVPWRFEAGTPNVAGVVGLSAALNWLSHHHQEKAEMWSQQLACLAEEQLSALPGFRSFR
ncbi:hypothetical protein CRX72_02895 [Pantoea sp. BRM17]|nr:hypothetical protein CRX72_02895 [Pantoea sp. BRM17]